MILNRNQIITVDIRLRNAFNRISYSPDDELFTIKDVGILVPLTVNAKYELVDGHGRYIMSGIFGINKIPVEIIEARPWTLDCSDAQLRGRYHLRSLDIFLTHNMLPNDKHVEAKNKLEKIIYILNKHWEEPL